MLLGKIHQDLEEAMKAKNETGLRTLRFLLSEINNLLIGKYPPGKGGLPVSGLPEDDVISVIQKLVKTHKESIDAFKGGGRQDLVDKEEAELTVLQKYLPQPMSEAEIKKVVEEVKASGLSDFGQMMREVMGRVKGKADGGLVAKVVKESL